MPAGVQVMEINMGCQTAPVIWSQSCSVIFNPCHQSIFISITQDLFDQSDYQEA